MMTNALEIEFLGTGTSQGVPVIGCQCDVCLSKDSRDKRLRSSIAIRKGNTQIVIDSGPDFRQQILRSDIENLNAIVFTHEHKDHISGMDDIRAFNYKNEAPMDIFCTNDVLEALKREYHYVFDEQFSYPGIPQVKVNLITKNEPFCIGNLNLNPVEVMHYQLPVLGFRIDNFAYITDANFVAEEEKNKLQGVDYLVVNALRKEKHISHFNLEEALEFIREINPKQAYLTHLSHLMGKHEDILKELPENVRLSYDGLKLEI